MYIPHHDQHVPVYPFEPDETTGNKYFVVKNYEIDVDNTESVKAVREVLGRRINMLDVLINNAGIGGKMPQTPLTRLYRHGF